MTTFAIADLHGRLDLLDSALARIGREGAPGGTVVFLGDYIDRGPDSGPVLDRLMAGPPDTNWRWICLSGNHEAMMVEAIETGDAAQWLRNGGAEALRSFGGRVSREHLMWCRSLKRLHADRHRVFVHAAVDPKRPLDRQSDAVLLWSRYRRKDDEGYKGMHVVHGHTPDPEGPLLLSRRTNLDTGAVFTGRLVVGAFDDAAPGGPRELIEILA